MKVYIKDILDSNVETKERYKIIKQSLYIQNRTGVEQELIITPQEGCYLSNDSNLIEDFLESYIEVEDYNESIYKAVVECEFEARYSAFMRDYYLKLKSSENKSKELEKYKRYYNDSQKTAQKLEEELYKAYRQVEEKNKEILSLQRELKYYKDKDSESDKSNKDEFENIFKDVSPELDMIFRVASRFIGGYYGK